MGAKCCGKAAEGHGCGCGTKRAEGDKKNPYTSKISPDYDTAYIIVDNSYSTSPEAGGHFDQFQGAALKTIDRTRGIKKFIIVGMNGQTEKEAFDKKTAKEIVKNMKPYGGTPLHGCGCGTKKADTATVQEPDWIPDGDGRAIGQQDFAINLSPLHADTVGSPSPTFDEGITGQDGSYLAEFLLKKNYEK